MPTYCYSNGNAVIERFYPMGEAPRKIRKGGKTFRRDFQAERPGARPPGNWPMLSDAMGCDESQVKDAEAESVKMGVPTHFTKEGCAVFTSPEHRKRYCEAFGFFDRNAGYSDPVPQ